jgi:hypothetical protein
MVAGFWTVIVLVGKIKYRLTITEEQNKGDINNIDDLWDAVKENRNKMEDIDRQRGQDVLLFTEAIGNLNVTLGKMEVTLENNNKVIEKIDKRMEGQDKEIGELKQKVG